MNDSLVIVGAARTPLGAFNGQFTSSPAPALAAVAVKQALKALPSEEVSELVMGCVLPAGMGQAAARQVVHLAGLSNACGASLVNKVCGSGLKSIQSACHSLYFQGEGLCVAGGMENMSLAPHLIPNARQGIRFGDAHLKDHLFLDGLVDAIEGKVMGEYAEQTAERFGFSREAQDAFAQESLRRAQRAISEQAFAVEIAPVSVPKSGELMREDEIPSKLRIDKIPLLKPAFKKEGTVTAANASSLSDGAAAVAISLESVAKSKGYPILARIRRICSHSHQPEHFTTAPIQAIQKLLDAEQLSVSDIDLWEINEAFAVVPMAAIQALNISHEQLNVCGGACALGHPLGATGTRIVVTLISAMQRADAALGVASLCIGGGEGMAILIERA